MPVGYGLNRKDKDIHKIGEEEIPLKDRSCAHDDEGVHDIEVVVSDLSPEWPRHWIRGKGMVGREEEERDQQARDGDGATDLHHALGFIVVGAEELVVKKAVEDVSYQNLELGLLTGGAGVVGLYGKRENGMSGGREEARSLTHDGPP